MKNKYVTEDKLKICNKDNSELGQGFLEYLSSIGRSKGTIYQYSNDLKICWVLLLDLCSNKFFVELTKRDIIKIQNFLLNNQKLSPARIRRFRSTISSMSNYIENILDDEFKDYRNIIGKIEAPVNTPVREIDYFDFKFAKSISNKLIKDGRIQQAFYLMIAVSSGARKAEILRLKMSDINVDKLILGSLYKTSKIETKGRGENLLNKYILKSLIEEYIPIFKEYRNSLGVDIEHIFFRKVEGGFDQAQISTADSFSDTIDRYFGDKHFHSHSARHTYVTELLKSGLPLEVVREVVGHKSSQTTEIYNEIDTSDLLAEYFDENGIKGKEVKSLSDL